MSDTEKVDLDANLARVRVECSYLYRNRSQKSESWLKGDLTR